MDSWDDTMYLRLAQRIRQGESFSEMGRDTAERWDGGVTSSINHFVMRRGVYYPVAVFQELCGENEVASALPSLLASLGTLLLIYRLGLLMVGKEAALFSALLFAIVPLNLVSSTRILSDVPHAFWLTASLVASVEGARRSGSRTARLVYYLLSGLAFHMAYLIRPGGLFFLLIVLGGAVHALRRGRCRLELLIIPLTVAALWALDGILFLRATGQFLLVHHLERAGFYSNFVQQQEALFYPLPGLVVHCSYQFGVLHHFFKMFVGTIEHYDNLKLFSSFVPLGGLAAAYALYRRQLGLLVIWLVGVFLFVQYGFRLLKWDGTEGILHYYLVPPLPRYLELLLPPLCILLGFFLAELKGHNRLAAAALFLLLACPSLYRAVHNFRFYSSSLSDMRQASRFLLQQGIAPVYTDPWAVEQLQFFSARQLRDVRPLREGADPEPGSWVVVGGSRGYDIGSEDIAALLPAPYAEIHLDPNRAPSAWKTVFQQEGRRNVARQTDLVIFQVPTDGKVEGVQ